jgi:hypothetical protein
VGKAYETYTGSIDQVFALYCARPTVRSFRGPTQLITSPVFTDARDPTKCIIQARAEYIGQLLAPSDPSTIAGSSIDRLCH